ncbi:MAG: DUF5946 family protein [Acidobacteriota bacterium]|nr:DUF5946 family protein [Acidobacteriota bacterium]
MSETRCPGCGVAMPASKRATYDGYFNASPECWSVFTEVIGAEFSNAVLFGQVHQLTVDAYAVQHAGGPHPDKSVAVHLSGLHLVIERGIPPTSVPPYLQQLATRVREWPHFDPPPVDTWRATIFDVATADDHVAAVREWSAGVWRGWSAQHEAIAQFVAAHLDVR